MHARFVLASLLLVASPLAAQAPADSGAGRPAQVRTVATAERYVTPDRATINLEIAAEARTVAAAGRLAATRADGMRHALVALGVPRDSLVSRSEWGWWRGRVEMLVSQPRSVQRQNYPRPGETNWVNVQDTTYRAIDAIEVHVRNLDLLGAIIDSAYAHGLTNISGVRFAVTTPATTAAAQEAALAEATDHARRQAEAIARAGGAQLGRVLEFSTTDPTPDRYYGLVEAGVTGLSASIDGGTATRETIHRTEVTVPTIPVRMTVYGRWELRPTR